MTLDGLMFENFSLSPFVDKIVSAFESFRPLIFDVDIMSVFVKGGAFEIIGHGRTKNLMGLCESHQDWF